MKQRLLENEFVKKNERIFVIWSDFHIILFLIYSNLEWTLNRSMKTVRLLVFNQNSYEAEDLAIKNGTTTSMCGYAVCGLC